jgi:D-methionine transport system permease protein
VTDWGVLAPVVQEATWETVYMVGVSTFITALVGVPLGVLLVATAPGGIAPAPMVNRILGAVVNIGRSLPFIILLVALIPLTRSIVGTTIGSTAAIVPLTIGAIPFYGRLVEASLREVSMGKVEAALAMGSTRRQVVSKVLVPEALPALVAGLTVTVVALVGYSAMAGAVGGGGLGDLAIRYGYQRFQTDVMLVTVVLLVILVQAAQYVGDTVARRLSTR